jgi:hypothetical protein
VTTGTGRIKEMATHRELKERAAALNVLIEGARDTELEAALEDVRIRVREFGFTSLGRFRYPARPPSEVLQQATALSESGDRCRMERVRTRASLDQRRKPQRLRNQRGLATL